ncbi:MAG: peptidylprolyl isomerase [Halieaceae bacterium]
MKIAAKTVASFHYTLKNEAGEELETSRDSEPTAYLHGAKNIIPGLERALEGHVSGDSLEVEVKPEDGYGPRNPDRIQRVPTKHLIFKGKLRPGMTVQLNTSEGARPVTVAKVGRHSADIDANHPLAGQVLTFAIDITDVREASAEELAHGHAHGAGGHQH